MTTTATSLDQLCIDTIRTLAMDAVQKAGSGHPGTPMGAATMGYALWTRFLRHNPTNPNWFDRDRFVLSAGHASVLLYTLLSLSGYDLQLEELQQLRQWGSRTPGHPERGRTPGVEVTTGPLGQGFGMAVGLAMAEHFLAGTFNRPEHDIIDHWTYVICSDGDMMEGVSSEAASFAGTMGLGKLVFLYDQNQISIEGDTAITFREDVGKRFEAYGWQVQHVDGEQVEEVERALNAARAETERPSLIIAKTTIAYGSPHLAGNAKTHGEPLGEDEVRATKEAIGWPPDEHFRVPPEALAQFREALPAGEKLESEWNRRLAAYREAYPRQCALLDQMMAGELASGWEAALPTFSAQDDPIATRVASGKCLEALARVIPNLVGGSADLAPSTKTYMEGEGEFGGPDWSGRNLHFGIREHGMGCIVNGMALHGGIIPFGATFLIFSDYMRASIRLAALQDAHSIFVFTHDSIGLGGDGPTHQPVEHLASLRAMPNMVLIRPADANETAVAWRIAISASDYPVALVLTRQSLPILGDIERVREGVPRGAYVLADADAGLPAVILIATGSEVSLALAARDLLAKEGIAARVVSMPSWELFEKQPDDYRKQVLPPEVRARVSVEAASPLGWERYVGTEGDIIGLDHFGASAPGEEIFKHFGFTPEAVAERANAVVRRLQEGRA